MTTMELIERRGIGYNCLSDAYDLGRADAYKELAPLFEDIVTMDNICEVLDGEWCEKNCGNTDKCLAKYVEQLKQSN